jgi:hypothetical protein
VANQQKKMVAPSASRKWTWIALATVLAVGTGAVFVLFFADRLPAARSDGGAARLGSTPGQGTIGAPSDPILDLTLSEELILALTPKLSGLIRSTYDLELPSRESRALFDDRVRLNDFDAGLASKLVAADPVVEISRSDWPVDHTMRDVPRDEIRLFTRLFDDVDYFDFAKFYLVNGNFTSSARDRFDAVTGFAAIARMRDGALSSFDGKLQTIWRQKSAGGGAAGEFDVTAEWVVTDWHLKSFTQMERKDVLFTEVLDEAIPDRSQLERARASFSERMIVQMATDPTYVPKNPRLMPHIFDSHSGISVVDIDKDGFDDLYVVDRLGTNFLLRNKGNGTFEDVAKEHGLDITDNCSSAIFADFDNDGDDDLFLGRTVSRSQYFVNENGRFVDRSGELIPGVPLPYLVSSIASADYNGDGLLDVYISTYAGDSFLVELNRFLAELLESKRPGSGVPPPTQDRFLAEFLSEKDAKAIFKKASTSGHIILDRPGPPNILLVNKGGGKFALSPEQDKLAAYRNTYQSTWGDFDGDGDSDLYLANDYAPNNLFRNKGDGTFEDATAETGTADIGFGMGAGWGDYDLDGKLDLYVTNMYSKAGLRITGKIPELRPEYAQMAHGNSLFKNDGARFAKTSGLDAPALLVEKAGWSWGGQFVDFDNDGDLDIHALSGNYTAHKRIAEPLDL